MTIITDKRIVVIAGNYHQFDNWRRRYAAHIPPQDLHHASGPERIRGLDPERTLFVLVGTYHNNPVYTDGYFRWLQHRGAEVIEMSI